MSKKEVLQRKQQAVKYFTQRLLSSPAGKDVACIILFGSLARGEADELSDIDVLVFGKNVERIEDIVWEVLLDAYERYEESIEPLVYPINKFQKPDNYFLFNSVRTGRQLYP